MTRAVRAILSKELRELWRDPLSLGLALGLPLVLLFIFTYGLNFDVQRVQLGAYNLENGPASRDYLAALTASGDLVVAGYPENVAELADWLDRGRIDLGLIIPPDFGQALLERRSATIQLLVDGAYPPRARAAVSQFSAASAFYNHRLLNQTMGDALASGPSIVAEPRVWFNPELESVNYIVPGLFSLILMTFVPLLSTLAIVRERERGSIQQILAAPVSPAAFIVGKAIPYALLAFVNLLLVLGAGLFWFRIPFRGSLGLFLVAGVIFVVCIVGLGLFISSITRSQVVAILVAIAATIMPSFLFSGFLYPMFSMPDRYETISQLFPARHFTELARGLALKGSGFDQLWPHVAALSVAAVGLLLLTVSRFHRRMG